MEEIDHLKNRGIFTTGHSCQGVKKTIVVLGVGRGGTSLCSTVLAKLGLFTGDRSEPPVYEDIDLARALETKDFNRVESIIKEYDSRFDKWAFKRPNTNDTIHELHKRLRNPCYLIIFRDILAIANRDSLSMGANTISTLSRAINDYSMIVEFLKSESPSALLASYEKIIKSKEHFVDQTIDFFGLENQVSMTQRTAAIQSIEPENQLYLSRTNAVQYYGHLDEANKSVISGWAAYNQSKKPVTLELIINDSLVKRFTALGVRKDVKLKNLHPTGLCGFEFAVDSNWNMQTGDQISVRYADTSKELRGSPKTAE